MTCCVKALLVVFRAAGEKRGDAFCSFSIYIYINMFLQCVGYVLYNGFADWCVEDTKKDGCPMTMNSATDVPVPGA